MEPVLTVSGADLLEKTVLNAVKNTIWLPSTKGTQSQTLAELLGKGHETARADHMFEWIRTPCWNLSTNHVSAHVAKEEARVIMGNVYYMLTI